MRVLKTDKKSKIAQVALLVVDIYFTLYPHNERSTFAELQQCATTVRSWEQQFLGTTHPVHDSLQILANTNPLKHVPEVFTGFLFILSHWAFPCFTSSPCQDLFLTTQLTWVLGYMGVKYLINALGLPAMTQRGLETEEQASVKAVYSIFIPLHTQSRYEINWFHSFLLFTSKCTWGQPELTPGPWDGNEGLGEKKPTHTPIKKVFFPPFQNSYQYMLINTQMSWQTWRTKKWNRNVEFRWFALE